MLSLPDHGTWRSVVRNRMKIMNCVTDMLKVPTDAQEKSAIDDSTPNPGMKSGDMTVQCPSRTTEAALVRKVDLKVLPILMILICMTFLDR